MVLVTLKKFADENESSVEADETKTGEQLRENIFFNLRGRSYAHAILLQSPRVTFSMIKLDCFLNLAGCSLTLFLIT